MWRKTHTTFLGENDVATRLKLIKERKDTKIGTVLNVYTPVYVILTEELNMVLLVKFSMNVQGLTHAINQLSRAAC